MAHRPLAPEEKYTAETKRAILDAIEAGDEHVALRFGLDVKEASLRRTARRWRANEAERGHLRNHKRGMEPGIKIVLDGPELDLLETLTNQFPDISAKEMITAFRGAGYRCVLPSYPPPLGISATSIDRTTRRTPHSQAAAADPSNHKFAARSRRIKSREVGRFSA